MSDEHSLFMIFASEHHLRFIKILTPPHLDLFDAAKFLSSRNSLNPSGSNRLSGVSSCNHVSKKVNMQPFLKSE